MKYNFLKIALIVLIVSLISAFFYFDLGQYLSFDFIKAKREEFIHFYNQNQVLTIVIYFSIYVAVTALSVPGAAMMTLVGGAIFGLVKGVIIISFASTIGATLAFLAARFLLKDSIQSKYADKLKAINEGVEKEGAFYLFTLRLIPAFPFFVINLLMGLTPIKTLTYFLVSQIGMLAGTIVYVNAGTQLGQLESASGILSPKLILSFVLLGLFPLIVKKIMNFIKKNKVKSK